MNKNVNRFVAHQKVGVTIQFGMALLYIFIIPFNSSGKETIS